jgi:glycosyltransferase involved in cell wall biosynthesis
MPLFWIGLMRRVFQNDVVHVFTAAFWPFALTTTPAVLVGRLLGKPVILNYRDGRAREHIRYAPVRWVLRRATVLAFPSEFLREIFADFGIGGVVISNVVDVERFRYRARVPLRPVLLSVRLLEELYAVENSLLAFAEVKTRIPSAHFIIVGDGDRRSSLEALVAERRIEGVRFVGRVPHHRMGEWFDRSDILVNSSRADNMPHCLIEAFAAGVPIVSTRAGGIPWIVQHESNGLLVPCDDPFSMANEICRLLEDASLSLRLVATGREQCATKYSWDAVRRQWAHLYGIVRLPVADPASTRLGSHQ